MSRRRLLGWLAGGGASALVAGGALRFVQAGSSDDADPTVGSVRRIGEAYLASVHNEGSEPALRRRLPVGWDAPEGQPMSRFGELRPSVRGDFADGHTTVVGGWCLSLAEARGAALVTLIRSGPGAEGPGMYRYATGGARHTLGQFPTSADDAGLFDLDASVTVYDELPAEGQVVDYPPPEL